jgi:uncharacterized membrane protein YbhN (UPF0104 family)
VIKYLLKLALSLGLFLWLIWNGEVRFEAFQQLAANRAYLILVVVSQAVLFLLVAVRWRILARSLGMEVRYFRILRFFLMGEFFSLFFLGAMGGDLSRMIFLGINEPQRKAAAILTVLIDKVMALWVLCAIGLAALLVYQPLSGASAWVRSTKWVLATPLVAIPVVLVVLRTMPNIRLPFTSKMSKYQPYLEVGTKPIHLPPLVLLMVGLLNLLAQTLVIVNFVFCGFALGIFHVPLSVYLLAVPLGFIALAMPFSIGGLGIGQLAFAQLFRTFGVTEEAFGGNLSTLHIAVWGLFALFGGVLFAIPKSRYP